ncbi:hypothetical protein ScPMuIL_017347 [Solemya velum]
MHIELVLSLFSQKLYFILILAVTCCLQSDAVQDEDIADVFGPCAQVVRECLSLMNRHARHRPDLKFKTCRNVSKRCMHRLRDVIMDLLWTQSKP